jgi:hypothetical protein
LRVGLRHRVGWLADASVDPTEARKLTVQRIIDPTDAFRRNDQVYMLGLRR